MKVETGEDELSTSSRFKKQKQWSRPYIPYIPAFLRLKDNVETSTDILPTIDSLPISLPIGYGPLEEFDQVELLTKFKLQAKQNELPVAKDSLTKSEVSTFFIIFGASESGRSNNNSNYNSSNNNSSNNNSSNNNKSNYNSNNNNSSNNISNNNNNNNNIGNNNNIR